jgi:hypothetical protein
MFKSQEARIKLKLKEARPGVGLEMNCRWAFKKQHIRRSRIGPRIALGSTDYAARHRSGDGGAQVQKQSVGS